LAIQEVSEKSCFGACHSETRIIVELILRKLSKVASETEILDAYPGLNRQDIQATIRYAADTLAHEEVVLIQRKNTYQEVILKFLADENCDFAIVQALRAAGHDVLAISEVSQARK
jgi:uncharacterized protein (DUF433 family)